MSYPSVESQPNLPLIEQGIQAFWEADKTFEASIAARPAELSADDRFGNEYVFYDGPPFANGLPHYGHLLTGYVKDAVPRYQTMRGRRVERQFGWDCHGLPADVPLPLVGVAQHARSAGALGRLRQRLQDPRPHLHGERHVGLQDAARQRPDL